MLRRLLRILLIAILAVLGLWTLGLVAYRWIDPLGTPLMVIRLFEGAGIDYRPRPLEAVAPALRQAVIAAEDNRFCTHGGIDWGAVQEALDEFRDGDRLRGASTITMQVARNLFLWPGGGFVRKAAELPLALAIDVLWPKRRILEVYLSIAEWGHGVYGAEAAAAHHFNTTAARLSRRQATLLAAVLPSPRSRSPARPTPYIGRRGGEIETRMDQLGPLLACAA